MFFLNMSDFVILLKTYKDFSFPPSKIQGPYNDQDLTYFSLLLESISLTLSLYFPPPYLAAFTSMVPFQHMV